MIASKMPPKYPAKIPNAVPTQNTAATMIAPENSEVCAPYRIRDRIHRPKASVPNGYCSVGLESWFTMSVCYGSLGDRIGARTAVRNSIASSAIVT